MTRSDFDYLCRFVRERSGLVLSPDKQYLVESRLLPVARRSGFADPAELARSLGSRPSLARLVVEALTTNETFFFRDKIPFDQFRTTMIPALLARRAMRRRVRIWCAAASSGQEPYSLAMALKEMGERIDDWRIDIIATDISGEVLEKARQGIYSQFEVQRGLPIALLIKYFSQNGENWQIAAGVRSMVRFEPLNLIGDFSQLGVFDVVFCRNVLLYFDLQTKIQVLQRLAQVIEPDGYLVLGAAETVIGLTNHFKPVAGTRGLYAPASLAEATAAPPSARTRLRVVAAAS